MLQLIGVSNVLPEFLETDDYIPLAIKWGNSDEDLMAAPKLYWSISDEYSILEVSIDSENKTMKGIKVINVGQDNVNYNSTINIPSPINSISGVPIWNTSNWESSPNFHNRYFQERGNFEIHISDKKVYIILYREQVISQIVSERVKLYMDQNNCLCAIEINNLTPAEMSQFRGTLQYQQANLNQPL